MTSNNLLGIPETRLDEEPEVLDDLSHLPREKHALAAIVEKHPKSSLAWAEAAQREFVDGRILEAYAYSRVGYHRGLDALRKSGWRGQGPIPWSHEPNQGVLRSFWQLRRAAEAIGENDEVERLTALLRDADSEAEAAIEKLDGVAQ
ncbi:DUF3151 domain-containing protein [Gulosibacter molinativorax]|uniref:DUF3151 domain-containing protein n=1 Tax=Gulosibacter molinativorax TaxID=256821 RepID=A0ABT7C7K9_9MICO|nr:DUF3151 domain-containing protein [Gulosibacter molinativorax]MDJ1371193.1 DUF3151 domain-containing protein [Gulosibacter molinativorax]QUY63008.1 Hypotetical protein [Gulosibacter molinativorax]